MNHKMKQACPVSNKPKSTIVAMQSTYYNANEWLHIKPDKHIMDRITISITKCPSLHFLQMRIHLIITWVIVTSYKFQIDAVLRLNITFLHFELVKPEKVDVINGNTCKRHPKRTSFPYSCFEV